MKVFITNSQKDLAIDRAQVRNLVLTFFARRKITFSEITVHFVTDKKMRAMHAEFFDDPSPTDCMTFPVDPIVKGQSDLVLGDIVVCPKTALVFSEKRGKEVYQELTLYIIHALLHLLGYDDINKKDRSLMRRKEREEMAYLKEVNAWLSPKETVTRS
ncbi:rRNA maturation RNase YbeY [Estrella lausannensis]|uniref:Endoribonuclease YbeY n=1 Tax=Estrella lausannensis TaxID=483423 RepID=A0A0H5DPE5_9BACT|nr:rRNA maturation RNase YbeY [Estrella lausannensis]CRX38297.1 Conserved hypothetical protein [Estrella lausannensis]